MPDRPIGADPASSTATPTLLFVCTHNAGRSALAAALARHRAGERASVLSAGMAPADHASEVTIASLAEIGIDDSAPTPRRVSDNLVGSATVVVAMKPGIELPGFPGVTYETWDLPDPGAWDVDAVRPLRDHIDSLVSDLLDRVLAEPRDRGTPRHT